MDTKDATEYFVELGVILVRVLHREKPVECAHIDTHTEEGFESCNYGARQV